MSSLRDRRRRQTTTEIQIATLDLIAEHGLANVTTEMIATRAGISPRTFFNYFTNKEAAAVGRPPEFPAEAVRRFTSGTGPLAEDLVELLRGQVVAVAADHALIERVFETVRSNPELQLSLNEVLHGQWAVVGRILRSRLPGADPDDLDLLADMLLATVRCTMRLWVSGQVTSVTELVSGMAVRLRNVGRLLAEA